VERRLVVCSHDLNIEIVRPLVIVTPDMERFAVAHAMGTLTLAFRRSSVARSLGGSRLVSLHRLTVIGRTYNSHSSSNGSFSIVVVTLRSYFLYRLLCFLLSVG